MKLPIVVRAKEGSLYLRKGRIVDGVIVDEDYYFSEMLGGVLLEKRQYNGRTYYVKKVDEDMLLFLENPERYYSYFVFQLFDHFEVYMYDEHTKAFFKFRTFDDIKHDYFERFEYRAKYKPFEHQVVGANFIVNNKKALLFWETGTGKSLAALLAFDYLYTRGIVKNMLIVCPNSLVLNWYEKHLMDCFPFYNYANDSNTNSNIDVVVISGLPVNERIRVLRGLCDKPNVIIITNYDTFSRMERDRKGKIKFDFVIFDESHYMKNNTNRTKNINALLSFDYCAMLTGTPIDGKYIDYYKQFAICGYQRPFFVGSITEFKREYMFQTRYGVSYHRTYKILRYINNSSFELRKEQCLELPEKLYTPLHIDLTPKHMEEYRRFVSTLTLNVDEINTQIEQIIRKLEEDKDNEELLEQLKALTARRGKDYVTSVLPKILYARMLVAGVFYSGKNAKIEWLKENLHEDEKYVIYCSFTHTINRITSELIGDFRVSRIYGAIDADKRHDIVRKFNSSDDINVIVANPKVGGIGIDLTAAHTCIFFDNDPSYIVRKQAEDRLHRIGQTNKVQYIDLIARKTIDEYIYNIIARKKRISDELFNITTSELKRILTGGEE
ncbi:MAG: DEAD/DEAH box helicase [candidate division WOR-3 bacterium]